jgi:predicted nucleotidyltransferase
MYIEDLMKANWKEILKIAAKHDARNILILGSITRGEADSKIDLDIL